MSPARRADGRTGRFGRSGHRSRAEAAGPSGAAPAGPVAAPPPALPPQPPQPPQPPPTAEFDPTTYYRPREPTPSGQTHQPGPGHGYPQHPDLSVTDHLPLVGSGPGEHARYRAAPPSAGPGPSTPPRNTRPYEPVPGPPTGGFGRPSGAPLPDATTVGPAVSATAVPKVTVTRAVAARSGQAAQLVARRVVAASRADGAAESGLTHLIWNQVLSFAADAMVTVALAGTVFFSAAKSDQKGNVLAYLLVTMAPFAVVAPVIGPFLDRFQHGRRWAMAASAFGRALLAVLMAQNFKNLYLLFPLALGSLVLSKAYSVVRAAAAPRLVPADMTLVTANARLSIFGLGAAVVGGGFVAGLVRLTGSYPLGLWVTAIGFAVTGYFALRLPAQVDSAAPARRHPEEPRRPASQLRVPPVQRIRLWVSRGFDLQVITSMQGESLLRWSAGFLTMFLAFYIEKTSHGFAAASSLGAVGAAVAVGNVIGTGSGARFSLGHPHVIVILCSAGAAVACALTAVWFSLGAAIACMAVCSATNSLGKLSLDAVIQRDVNETLRSSAFARSETFLQLAWVLGAAVALLLPAQRGTLGMSIAGTFMIVGVIVMIVRSRAGARNAHRSAPMPGNL